MLVPEKLDGWTYEAISQLCAVGMGESDRHDFKAGLQPPDHTTKTCCAFANSLGGFLVYGVAEKKHDRRSFLIAGVEPDREFGAEVRQRIRADPHIEIVGPKLIQVPGVERMLYVFHVPRSVAAPHLPSQDDQRVFWKRVDAGCARMTLEEVRSKMLNYEEKRDQLTLLLIDLHHKRMGLQRHANAQPGWYYGDTFDFALVDQIVATTYSLLKADPEILTTLQKIREFLEFLNFEKQKLMMVLTGPKSPAQTAAIDDYTKKAQVALSENVPRFELIEGRLSTLFDIVSPFRVTAYI